jgi:hypothetical protein
MLDFLSSFRRHGEQSEAIQPGGLGIGSQGSLYFLP